MRHREREVLEGEVLSSLAEGTDRLVVRRVLARPGASLVAVLPLPRLDYLADFESPQSRQEFLELLGEAETVIEMPAADSRKEAYEQAGRYVVEYSDVLVTVWDGLPARAKSAFSAYGSRLLQSNGAWPAVGRCKGIAPSHQERA
jgi:hypothetical protein